MATKAQLERIRRIAEDKGSIPRATALWLIDEIEKLKLHVTNERTGQ